MICQKNGNSQPLIGTTQELPPFPWHTLATDLFYWKKMDFLIVADVFSKYIIVRKLPNSTSAAMCIELSMIVTELGSPHIIRSDNGPCYNFKEFQQFLQCYSITHQTSSPNHPRSNGFIERMVGVAKKLMDKAGKEEMTQCTPREKTYPSCPVHLVHQKCTKPTRNSSKGNGARVNLKGSIKNYSQVHQYGCNIGKMLHGNQQ